MTTSRAARGVLALLGVLTGIASVPLHGATVQITPIRHLIVIVRFKLKIPIRESQPQR
jgi:hypothetical protein